MVNPASSPDCTCMHEQDQYMTSSPVSPLPTVPARSRSQPSKPPRQVRKRPRGLDIPDILSPPPTTANGFDMFPNSDSWGQGEETSGDEWMPTIMETPDNDRSEVRSVLRNMPAVVAGSEASQCPVPGKHSHITSEHLIMETTIVPEALLDRPDILTLLEIRGKLDKQLAACQNCLDETFVTRQTVDDDIADLVEQYDGSKSRCSKCEKCLKEDDEQQVRLEEMRSWLAYSSVHDDDDAGEGLCESSSANAADVESEDAESQCSDETSTVSSYWESCPCEECSVHSGRAREIAGLRAWQAYAQRHVDRTTDIVLGEHGLTPAENRILQHREGEYSDGEQQTLLCQGAN